MEDQNIPLRYWDVVAEHGVLLNAVASPAIDETTKTIFETTCNQPPDYDAIPPVGCFAVRLLEKQHRKEFCFGLTDRFFFGYSTESNIHGAVLLAEKAQVLGRIQVTIDPNLFPLTDKRSDNPRYKLLHTLPCRGSDTIDGDDNSVVGDAMEIALQDFFSATHDDLPSDADNAVSSDDDDARMVLLSDLLQSSPVPAFNPDRAPAAGASSDFLLFFTASSP